MTAKDEIIRRLKKHEYTSLSRTLYDKSFDSLSDDEYKQLLKIADMYGSKYKQFYRIANGVDIRTITSNLDEIEYNPTFTPHNNLQIIGIDNSENSFTIYAQFFTQNEEWVLVEENGQRIKRPEIISFRRVLVIEKPSQSNYLILSVDPIGEGAAVSRDIPAKLDEIRDEIQLDIRNFFDINEIEDIIYNLIGNEILIPDRIIAKDEQTNRLKSVVAQTRQDNIKDDDIFESCTNQNYELKNLKMKFNGETIEIFGQTLLKIATKANKEVTDELTNHIISVLQSQ